MSKENSTVMLEVAEFMISNLSYPMDAASKFLGDWISYKRENWLAVVEKVKVTKSHSSIDLKYAIPIMENASVEDDVLIQDMWAGLISNSLITGESPKKVIISILSELDHLDAIILINCVKANGTISVVEVSEGIQNSFDDEQVMLSLQNLQRLGLVLGVSMYRSGSLEDMDSQLEVTLLGKEVAKTKITF